MSVSRQVGTLWVVAGVIVEEGRVLVAQRKKGSQLAGAWEFPGGKVEQGEDPRAALCRELREELGVEVQVGNILELCFEARSEGSLVLLFFAAERTGDSPAPQAIDAAALRWADPLALREEDFAPADRVMLRLLRGRLRASGRDAASSSWHPGAT